MEECLFCKIIAGKIPCSKVYEDERVIGFLDIFPVNKGHTLIVPKKHSEDMLSDSDEDLKSMMIVARKVAKSIMATTGADGINLIGNTKKAAGQVVFHTHMHLIPRYLNDGLKHWPQGKYNEGEAAPLASKIAAGLI